MSPQNLKVQLPSSQEFRILGADGTRAFFSYLSDELDRMDFQDAYARSYQPSMIRLTGGSLKTLPEIRRYGFDQFIEKLERLFPTCRLVLPIEAKDIQLSPSLYVQRSQIFVVTVHDPLELIETSRWRTLRHERLAGCSIAIALKLDHHNFSDAVFNAALQAILEILPEGIHIRNCSHSSSSTEYKRLFEKSLDCRGYQIFRKRIWLIHDSFAGLLNHQNKYLKLGEGALSQAYKFASIPFDPERTKENTPPLVSMMRFFFEPDHPQTEFSSSVQFRLPLYHQMLKDHIFEKRVLDLRELHSKMGVELSKTHPGLTQVMCDLGLLARISRFRFRVTEKGQACADSLVESFALNEHCKDTRIEAKEVDEDRHH